MAIQQVKATGKEDIHNGKSSIQSTDHSLRKKLGNSVFTANRFGAVVRKRVKGVNPKSTNQNLVRGDFSISTKAYSGLTTTQQSAWDSAAALIPKTDIFGKVYTNTGAQFQTQVNTVRQIAGLSLATTPPATGGLAPAVATAVSAVGSTGCRDGHHGHTVHRSWMVLHLYDPGPEKLAAVHRLEIPPGGSRGVRSQRHHQHRDTNHAEPEA